MQFTSLRYKNLTYLEILNSTVHMQKDILTLHVLINNFKLDQAIKIHLLTHYHNLVAKKLVIFKAGLEQYH